MTFGEKLRETRKARGMTTEFVAGKLGIKRSAYQSYEAGHSYPKHDTLKEICELLDVSSDYLFGIYTSHDREFAFLKKNMEIIAKIAGGVK